MIINGDCLEEMRKMEENSVDSIITDPPYGLDFMGKDWDAGVPGKQFWIEALRVAKPGAHLIAFGGCYDKETEILTKKGWKYFNEVTKEDFVATLNPENQEIIYQKPLEIVKYDNYKKLYHFKTNKIDLMVTPNHKMFVKNLGGYKNSKWKLTRADEVKNAIKMKKNGVWNGDDVEYFILPSTKQNNGHYVIDIPEKKIPMDIWLKFLGLWIAEGSSTITNTKAGFCYNTQICHFNNENLDELEKELSPYFNICRYKEHGKFRINGKQLAEYLQPYCYSWLKHVPEEIKQLSSRQLKILLDWYMRGDSDGRRCYTCSKKLVDDLQEVALKIGLSADYVVCKEKKGKIKNREITQKHKQYAVSINFKQNEPEAYQRKRKTPVVTTVDYDDFVYCVEVPLYHTLYVRREGKTAWCGNTRTWHRLACAIEDAGWELRDNLAWVYATGMPKGQNISKALKKNGSDLAEKYVGWNTTLKPCFEPIIMARKPLCGTVVQNVKEYGTGGINIDACRIGTEPSGWNGLTANREGSAWDSSGFKGTEEDPEVSIGRWPGNFLHDGSEQVLDLFPQTSKGKASMRGLRLGGEIYGSGKGASGPNTLRGHDDEGGSAARFYFCAKHEKLELLFCRARYIMSVLKQTKGVEPCFQENASIAESSLCLSNRAAVSVLSDAVILVSRGDRLLNDVRGLSTTVTEKALETLSETLIVAMLISESAALPAPRQDVLIQNGCRVNIAAIQDQTGIMTITISPPTFDGFAGDVTFDITSSSMVHGEKDSGSDRFRYCAKASRLDRDEGCDEIEARNNMHVNAPRNSEEEKHATIRHNYHVSVKPFSLMEWLVKLVTPAGGVVLDPFCGSGSTGKAAVANGFEFIGIDLDEGYCEIARKRVAFAKGLLA